MVSMAFTVFGVCRRATFEFDFDFDALRLCHQLHPSLMGIIILTVNLKKGFEKYQTIGKLIWEHS